MYLYRSAITFGLLVVLLLVLAAPAYAAPVLAIGPAAPRATIVDSVGPIEQQPRVGMTWRITNTGDEAATNVRAIHYASDNANAGPGNDYVDCRDGAGGDFVDCGPGRDTVLVDRGDRTRNCEIRR